MNKFKIIKPEWSVPRDMSWSDRVEKSKRYKGKIIKEIYDIEGETKDSVYLKGIQLIDVGGEKLIRFTYWFWNKKKNDGWWFGGQTTYMASKKFVEKQLKEAIKQGILKL